MPALDKRSQLAAAAAEKQRKLILATRRLDPRFPYKIIPLDLAYFGLPVDPIPAETGLPPSPV